MDRIILPEIRIKACHGVYQEEKDKAQSFTIAVILYLDLSNAAKSDDVADTVHYGELYDRIVAHASTNHYALIEALADNIADIILAEPKVEKCQVAVTKQQAKTFRSVFPASVVIERSRMERG